MVDKMTKKLTLAEAASLFLANRAAGEGDVTQQAILRFVMWYGRQKPLASLTAPEIAGYAEKMPRSETDYSKKLGLVRSFLGYAHKKGWLKGNLAVHLKASGRIGPQRQLIPKQPQIESITETRQGYEEMKRELADLKERRLKAIEDMRLAAADKDFRENAPLDAAREQRDQIDGRIRELETALKSVVVVDDSKANTDKGVAAKIGIGDAVVLRDLASGEEVKYTIVRPREVDPSRGKISSASPIGRAIVGRSVGDITEITAPVGKLCYRIERVVH